MNRYVYFFLFWTLISGLPAHAQSAPDYDVNIFYDDYGWFYCSLVHKSNITLLCYANQNDYHKSGKPIYILQGTIGAPNRRNMMLGDGDPAAGLVSFKVIYTDPSKKSFLPRSGSIWYKANPEGLDQLEMEAGEATLDVLIEK